MKLGVALSTTAHAVILSWGLLNLAAPAPLEVADVEALPVDIVPLEEFTRSIEGDRTAALSETPAPVPTRAPQTVPEAQNTGDAENDLRSNRDAEQEKTPVDAANQPSQPEAPQPVPEPSPREVSQPDSEDVPAPTNEVTASNEPAIPVTEPAPAEESAPVETAEQFASLDSVQAVPTRRPEPPKPRTAETQRREQRQEPPKTSAQAKPEVDESLTDEIASLLNKQDPAASGAKRSEEQAALGTSRPSPIRDLSTSEMDALRNAIANCWVQAGLIGMPGIDEVRSTVTMQLATDGSIIGRPTAATNGGPPQTQSTFEGSVLRAVRRCAPYSQLPADKYDTWSEVVINFSASDLL